MIDEKVLLEALEAEETRRLLEGLGPLTLPPVERIIRNQPKVMEWIPVSEPPETPLLGVYSEDVLTALKWHSGDITYSVGWYNSKTKKWREYSENCKVIAWMPLPEPYKGE